ncbi:MAG: serine hydrolase [Bacillota bacterium]|nr:serine hydrolase [Bacillota bacterium]
MERIYYPGPGRDWERRKPAEAGMNEAAILEAIRFHHEHDSISVPYGVDAETSIISGRAGEPYNELIGPVKQREEVNGLIIRHGRIVAEWGPIDQIDMTFSVSKSYLSATAGLALDSGLIRCVHDRVADYVQDGGFDSPHNAKITWHMMLNQTSSWEGTLWGKPDWCDRPEGPGLPHERALPEPGTVWKYNDVRVNRLALALLRVWRRPLPLVLREGVMDPIGASHTWQWHGYDNSWVTVDGLRVQSVAGGAHWGGGMWISTLDHARFGYLHLRRGKWEERRVLSEDWINLASTPTPVHPVYGYMNWYLNTGREQLPAASETSFFHGGQGRNVVYVDFEHDLVVVARWIENSALPEFIRLVLAAVRS